MTAKDAPAVAVLMSTYNGEKYIREQLDSIFDQHGVNVKLFVRDDGSSDATMSILNEYKGRCPVDIMTDGENAGPGESFMRLLYMHADDPDIDYYAFADQDDIWLEDKLASAVKRLDEAGDEPALYSSNQYLFADEENRGLRHKEPQRVDLISHMTKNTIAGCTFVFNKTLAGLVAKAGRPDPRIVKYRLHDAWMMLVAICCGNVKYDEEAHMLYRIHNENLVGVKQASALARLEKIKRYFVKRDDANLRLLTAKELLRLYPQIDDDKRSILRLYADYQKDWSSKKALAFNTRIRENCCEKPIVFTLKVLTNFV